TSADLGKAFRVEPPAGVADIDEVFAFINAEDERPEVAAASLRFGVASDHRLLAQVSLDLHPVVGPRAFAVTARAILGDDPFEPLLLGRAKECDSIVCDVLANDNVRKPGDQFREQLFPFEQWDAAKVAAVEL